jgi:tetratricopeptide (TPR) repeat protein
MFRALGDQFMVVVGLSHLGAVQIAQEEYAAAEAALREVFTLIAAINGASRMMGTLDRLGRIAQAQGKYVEATYFFRESVALSRTNGERWNRARALAHLGEALDAQGEAREAWASFQAALQLAMEACFMPVVLESLAGLATLLAHEGAGERALELLVHILAHPTADQEVKDRAGRLQSKLVACRSPEQVVTLQERARARSFEVVVDEVLRAPHERYIDMPAWEQSSAH